MRFGGYFAEFFFPTSEADRTSTFLPHLRVMSSSHFSLFEKTFFVTKILVGFKGFIVNYFEIPVLSYFLLIHIESLKNIDIW